VDLYDPGVMIANGEARRAGVSVVLCIGLLLLGACTESKADGAASPASPAPPAAPASSAPPAGSAGMGTAKTIAGTAFYLEAQGANLIVHKVRGGADTKVTIAADSGSCPNNSAVVSPDGKRIAWVSTGGEENSSGKLMVSDLSGANRKTLSPTVACLGSTSLAWLGSTQIAATDVSSGDRVLLNATNGQPAGKADQGVWSVDGKWLATTHSDKPTVTPKGNAGGAHTFTYKPPADEAEHYDGWDVRSVSVDGRYVSVGWTGTDPGRQLGSFAVVDTTNSKVVKLPVNGEVSSVHFLADGTALVTVRGGQLVLLDQHLAKLDQTTAPSSVRNLELLEYVLN